MNRLLIPALLLAAPLVAQERLRSHLHAQLGIAGGQFSFENDTGGFDDHQAASLFSLEFEAASKRGIGGGLRFEGSAIDNGDDDDEGLFRDRSNPGDFGLDARNTTLFGHFTYRVEEHRFAMPIRVGLLFNGLVLEDNNNLDEIRYLSFGPCLEVEPEITLVRQGRFRFSLYGQLGVGACGTSIDVDTTTDNRDYDSSTAFVNAEAGVRFRYAFGELGLAYIGRFQSMDRSDIEANSFVPGYDAWFQGVLFTCGVVF